MKGEGKMFETIILTFYVGSALFLAGMEIGLIKEIRKWRSSNE